MKKIIIVCVFLHFFYSIVYNSYLTLNSYLSFYGLNKDNNRPHTLLNKFTQLDFSRYIARYTGSETGFGFFAPNVLTSSVIIIERKGKVIVPKFSNHENEIRYTNLASDITSKMLETSDKDDTIQLKEAILGKYHTMEEVDSAYYNLVFKGIGVPYLNFENDEKDTVRVKLLLYDYPSLKSYASNEMANSKFVSLYSTKVCIK